MPEKQILPYGLWPSPISPLAAGMRPRLEDVHFDSDGETLVWLERRSGQRVLVAKRQNDAPRDLTDDVKIGAGVGYGGGDFTVRNGMVVFAGGGRLYRTSLGYERPSPITPAFGDVASPAISPDSGKTLFVHSYERKDSLDLVDSAGSAWPVKLAKGADFYMQPTWHPDGQRIAWVEWDHPQMPWDGTRLMTARLQDNKLSDIRQVAGDQDTPVFQPEFSPDGRWLAYLIQDGEWDSLCMLDLVSGEKRILVQGCSLMDPAWIQGMRTISWASDSTRIFYLRNDSNFRSLWVVEAGSGKSERLATGSYTWLKQITAGAGNRVAFLASSSKIPSQVVSWENGGIRIERRSDTETISPDGLPDVREISWQAPDGTLVYGLYYPPSSARYKGEGLPPAIVNIHGGPTSACQADYNSDAAFFTTRGYAFLEVNYRGSTGFGRSYMLSLRQKWGPLDVEDAIGAADALAAQELADPKRIVIMGGSAGGYTVLNALVHHPGVFRAGVDLFGLANLFIVETHKFEERYNDSLIGILPQDAERYRAWSPVNFADKIRDPVAVFQGADDNVVPPEHSEQIVAALRANKVPYVYKLYEGEGHGFRKTETIVDFYNTLEKFLQEFVLYA